MWRPCSPANPDARLVVPDLVRLECLVVPYRSADSRLVDDFERRLADFQHALIKTSTFDLAAHLRADHGLKTPDAIHLAAALEAGCGKLWTNDDRFARAGPRSSSARWSELARSGSS